ncbi:MAG: helix-turn-helix domain-containing protein, partial [Eubacteriales bacterium]|nr:helix-turn-helix domain-containing protein [Eubacteriales bacterium]
MSKEKQILQLREKGYSQLRIADTLKVSRNTVSKVFGASQKHAVSADALETLDDRELQRQLFPETAQIPLFLTPDYDYIHKELMKSGVTLRLLWEEYTDTCRGSEKPPYMYSQFCKL